MIVNVLVVKYEFIKILDEQTAEVVFTLLARMRVSERWIGWDDDDLFVFVHIM